MSKLCIVTTNKNRQLEKYTTIAISNVKIPGFTQDKTGQIFIKSDGNYCCGKVFMFTKKSTFEKGLLEMDKIADDLHLKRETIELQVMDQNKTAIIYFGA